MSETRPASSVRKAAERDLDEIAAIEGAWATTAHWTRALFEAELSAPRSLFCVSERSGRILGFACMRLTIPEAELLDIAVAPEAARQGVGRLLLEHLHREARVAG